MKIFHERDVYSTIHCTGPTYLKLSIRLGDAPSDSPLVEIADASPRRNPDSQTVVAACVAGALRANAKYRSSFHPTWIRCSIDHYGPSSILDYVTFKIVEFAAIPSFAPALQRSISDSPLSFHKLSAESGVAKSVLSSIAKSGSVDGIEHDVVVTLIEHFHLHTGS